MRSITYPAEMGLVQGSRGPLAKPAVQEKARNVKLANRIPFPAIGLPIDSNLPRLWPLRCPRIQVCGSLAQESTHQDSLATLFLWSMWKPLSTVLQPGIEAILPGSLLHQSGSRGKMDFGLTVEEVGCGVCGKDLSVPVINNSGNEFKA